MIPVHAEVSKHERIIRPSIPQGERLQAGLVDVIFLQVLGAIVPVDNQSRDILGPHADSLSVGRHDRDA